MCTGRGDPKTENGGLAKEKPLPVRIREKKKNWQGKKKKEKKEEGNKIMEDWKIGG